MRKYKRNSYEKELHTQDEKRCAALVYDGWGYDQCSRPRSSGKDGALCKQHAKSIRRCLIIPLDDGSGGFE